MFRGKTVLAAFGVSLLAGGLSSFAAVSANAAPIYGDTQVTANDQSVDAITSIEADASWGVAPADTTCGTTPSALGNSITVVPVPRLMCVAFSAGGTHGTLTWSIVPGSEVNVPAGVSIGISSDGHLTVTPPGGSVIPNNNQDISLQVKAADGTGATAFETLTAQPIIFNGAITAINVTAVTDDVTLIGTNNNVTDTVDFASTPVGAGLTLANAPDGVTLNGNHLTATSARPDRYSGLSVTATDAMGATAVDTFRVEVDGAIIANDTPRLSQGHAVRLNAVRENVYVVLSGQDACLHFTIVGPGKINGHQGWVPGHLGLNPAVYGGLEAHHGYTVYYQPVSGPADCSTHSVTLWPGAHWGYVYFVS